ncbi:MAG: rRNA pseudouridine synthase [Symploca sp. SIO1B1]|nr:rRNA pseudouridine synthase [Symploca sp. SIO2D2]NER49129.1 rRNA pseudouridine synthase [Symploca sp. SIO1A3]NER93740.1 rRNA pseudouridine synthase [Symploca sp. SIO1B1]
MKERVQKIISQWGVASRRQAEKMILAGQVRLNGNQVHLGQKANPETDLIEVNGKILKPSNRPQSIYVLLNKPAGVVSTCHDSRNRTTVLDLLPKTLARDQGLHPVGRLDVESTGALLLTNDGVLTFYLTHPRYHIAKTYHVWVEDYPPESILKLWRQGVNLAGKKTLPAQVQVLKQGRKETLLEIVLKEGRNRQIRRVADLLGYQVINLHRIAIGTITLQESVLSSGCYRHLQELEINSLYNQVHLTSVKVPADIKEYHL